MLLSSFGMKAYCNNVYIPASCIFRSRKSPICFFRDIIDGIEFRVDTASIILLMEGVSPFATERLDMYCPVVIFVNKYLNKSLYFQI